MNIGNHEDLPDTASKLWSEIPEEWREFLDGLQDKEEFKTLAQNIDDKYNDESVCPTRDKLFRALELSSPKNTRVVILGHDPYTNNEQAMGLAFSVPTGKKVPPSLRNILVEVQKCGYSIPKGKTNLSGWASQGVLLLNCILTVKEKSKQKKPNEKNANTSGSHSNIGWDCFTNKIIEKLSKQDPSPVFLLWGNKAKGKKRLISEQSLVLMATHPDNRSVKGFRDKKHFSKANEYLKMHGLDEIRWEDIR